MYLIRIMLLLVVILFSACRYEDGPGISFRSSGNRIAGSYSVVGFYKNGEDYTTYYQDSCGCSFHFSYDGCVSCHDDDPSHPCEGEDGMFTMICPNNGYNFCPSWDSLLTPTDTFRFYLNCWNFEKGKNNILANLGSADTLNGRLGMFPFNLGGGAKSIEIIRLTDDELWFRQTVEDDEYEIHLKE